ncbi:hypothetical protein BKA65DRAFT_600060 [Rhexocercosporidium sp. MPI-PUGE-AT-0058]|nr:hypothetical protein BKA65DRAFT_600060 [Rhexocercosporidium sp. MPI-PUGE-AT-0058]
MTKGEFNSPHTRSRRAIVTSVSPYAGPAKQSYAETNGLAWKLNTLVLGPVEWVLPSDTFDAKQLIHVDLDIGFRRSNDVKFAVQAFQKLGMLASTGGLRTLTLSPARGLLSVVCLGELKNDALHLRERHPISRRGQFQRWLRILREAGANKDLKEKKIFIITWWHSFTYENSWRALRFLAISGFPKVLDALKDMHDTFGGELWQDGTLCFKDGVKISRPFKLPPGVGEEYDRREVGEVARRNQRREKRQLGEQYSDEVSDVDVDLKSFENSERDSNSNMGRYISEEFDSGSESDHEEVHNAYQIGEPNADAEEERDEVEEERSE